MKNFDIIKNNARLLLSIIWVSLSISIGFWWLTMGLRQANYVAELQQEIGGTHAIASIERLNKYTRMIKYEGTFFIGLLISGGLAIFWLSWMDIKRSKMIKEFFATVTHEMKTPLASLRLQVESLEEELGDSPHKALLERLIMDSKRLELQMDKALYLASINRSESLYIERTSIQYILKQLQIHYPQIKIYFTEDYILKIDKKAFESILKNLIENALIHGEASEIYFDTNVQEKYLTLKIFDNGKGFQGNIQKLGKPFVKHSTSSGNGLGIYLIQKLTKCMNGNVQFSNSNQGGFQVELLLPIWTDTKSN